MAMSGVLIERICYDKLLKNEIKAGDHVLNDKEKEDVIFNLPLRHEIELLKICGLIKDDTRTCMLKMNDLRNDYVHPQRSLSEAQKDTEQALKHIKKILENEFSVKAS